MGITQERVAVVLGIDPGLLGRYLRGIRPMPDGFEERVHTALDQIEEEQRVAREAVQKLRAEKEARERVLAEGRGVMAPEQLLKDDALARIHRRTPMDGVRTAEGGG